MFVYFLKVSGKEKPTLEDSKEKITEALISEKISEDSKMIAKTWSDIREKYNLNIVETTIKNDYETTINSLKNASFYSYSDQNKYINFLQILKYTAKNLELYNNRIVFSHSSRNKKTKIKLSSWQKSF